MQVIFFVIKRNFLPMIYVLFLFFLLIIIYTLLAMRMFEKNTIPGQLNFMKPLPSFFLILKIVFLSDWYIIMRKVMLSNNQKFIFNYLFFVSLIIIGNFIVLNLLIAILIDSFEIEDELIFEEFQDMKEKTIKFITKNLSHSNRNIQFENNYNIIYDLEENLEGENNINEDNSIGNCSVESSVNKRKSENSMKSPSIFSKKIIENSNAEKKIIKRLSIPTNFSFFIFNRDNFIRNYCYIISVNSFFNIASLFFLILSTFKIMLETFYHKEDNDHLAIYFKRISFILSISINLFFSFVIAIKSIAFGFILKPKSFCRDFLNIINLFAVVGFYLNLFIDNVSIDILKVY